MLPVRLGAGASLGDFCEDRLELKDGIRVQPGQAPLEIQEA